MVYALQGERNRTFQGVLKCTFFLLNVLKACDDLIYYIQELYL